MIIRKAELADAKAMLEIYSPHIENSVHSMEFKTPSLAEFEKRVENTLKKFPWLVAEEGGEVVGYAYASPMFEREGYKYTVRLSIYVSDKMQRKGFGKRLVSAMEGLLLKQGYRLIYSVVVADNKDSIAFHTAVGFCLQARLELCAYKFGEWHDVVYMVKRLSMQTPTEIVPFAEMKVDYDSL